MLWLPVSLVCNEPGPNPTTTVAAAVVVASVPDVQSVKEAGGSWSKAAPARPAQIGSSVSFFTWASERPTVRPSEEGSLLGTCTGEAPSVCLGWGPVWDLPSSSGQTVVSTFNCPMRTTEKTWPLGAFTSMVVGLVTLLSLPLQLLLRSLSLRIRGFFLGGDRDLMSWTLALHVLPLTFELFRLWIWSFSSCGLDTEKQIKNYKPQKAHLLVAWSIVNYCSHGIVFLKNVFVSFLMVKEDCFAHMHVMIKNVACL